MLREMVFAENEVAFDAQYTKLKGHIQLSHPRALVYVDEWVAIKEEWAACLIVKNTPFFRDVFYFIKTNNHIGTDKS